MPWKRPNPDLQNDPSYLTPRLNEVDAQLAEKATKTEVDSKVSQIVSGSPKGTYTTLSALQTDKPSGDTGIYVVSADGKWYYWNGSNWVEGGLYQSTGIATNSLSITKLKGFTTGKNILNPETYTQGKYINPSTTAIISSSLFDTSDFIPVSIGETYACSTTCRTIGHFDSNKNLVSASDYPNTFVAAYPYIRVSVNKSDINNAQVEKNASRTAIEPFSPMIPSSLIGALPGEKFQDNSIPEGKLSSEYLTKTNTLFQHNIKCFERYKDSTLTVGDSKLVKGLSAIQDIEIIGLDPSVPVKLWILSRARETWRYRFIFGKKVNGVWSTLIDSQVGYEVSENSNGVTQVSYSSGGITVNMRIQYGLIEGFTIGSASGIIDGSSMSEEPLFVISPENVRLNANDGTGGGEAYDQSLNTTDSVVFTDVTANSVNTDVLSVSGTIPSGTLAIPPTGLLSGDMWADTTDSATHPIVRIKL
jgi:hypothetical protein